MGIRASCTTTVAFSDVRVPPENVLGDVWWSEAETHEVENISGRNVHALIIELKSGSGSG